MCATRKFDVKNWDFMRDDERSSVKVEKGCEPIIGLRSEHISYVEEEVMYWHNASHIHAWFVENVQSGKDDCGHYRVSNDALRQLLSVCERVLEASKLVDGTIYAFTVYDKDHPEGKAMRQPGKVIVDATVAKELLPTKRSFLFGCKEYDESYLRDVEITRDWIASMFADLKARQLPTDIFYHADW